MNSIYPREKLSAPKNLCFFYLLFLKFWILGSSEVPFGKQKIDDFSTLNSTPVHQIIYPKNYDEIAAALSKAGAHHLKISIAGKRHSQGGHTSYTNALVIDTKNLNKILSFDIKNKVITVQTGVTWKQIQEYINPYNLSIRVMQYANVLSIGGSLSVNANGIDPRNGPLIEAIKSIKIMTANGHIVQASKAINPELFKLAIGGYGLFGVILEAEIMLTENLLYDSNYEFIPWKDYLKYLQAHVLNNPFIELHHAQMCLAPYHIKDYFAGLFVKNFFKNSTSSLRNKKPIPLKKEPNVKLHKLWLDLIKKSGTIRTIRNIVDAIKPNEHISRNNALSVPVSYLYEKTSKETDLLQEYFIPLDKITDFLVFLQELIFRYHINVLYIDLRLIRKNTEAFISYTKNDCIGVVLFFNHKKTLNELSKTKKWSCELIRRAIDLGGTYYLPIQLHACTHLLRKAYPEITNFFELKKLYDPHQIFVNHFYNKYASNDTHYVSW